MNKVHVAAVTRRITFGILSALLVAVIGTGCDKSDGNGSDGDVNVIGPSTWSGSGLQSEGDFSFTMILNIVEQNGSSISGIITYPSVDNGQSRFSGSVSGNSLTFTEYEVISGSQVVPAHYKATISGTTMSGTGEAYEQLHVSFQLTRQ